MKRLVEILGSLKLTLALLLALAGLFALGLAVPQKAVLGKALFTQWYEQSPTLVRILDVFGLTDIHRSPLAIGLWAIFFLNLAVVMLRRVPVTLRRIRIDGEIPDPEASRGFVYRHRLPGPEPVMSPVRAFFQGRGFAVHETGGRLRAVRYRFAPVATLLFHLSFFLVAIGAIASSMTRFEGRVDLGEGEEFTGDLAQYAEPPALPLVGEPPAVSFVVEDIESEVVGKVPVAVRVHLRDRTLVRRTIEVNRPYRVGDTSFVFINLGVAPAFIVRDAVGRERFRGFIRLNVLDGRVDEFELLGLRFSARFFPDYVVDEMGNEASRSGAVGDPVLKLTAMAASGRAVSASLRPGDVMRLGPYSVELAEWRYWARLYVRAERGLAVVWVGFALAAVALVWRLVLFRREYLVAPLPDGGIVVAGRGEYYTALFEAEAQKVVRALESALTDHDGER